jgi:hypothetical protein
MQREIPLVGGRVTAGVVRVGDTVRRPIKEKATFVQGLLSHLEKRGFQGAPRFLGIDGAGREILSFIPGFVPPELGAFSDEQLAAAARLLRQLHDATLDCPSREGHEVVCHGDASPCNCVFVAGTPAAFIDFDNAHPGSRLEDVGYASWLWLDIGNDEVPADVQGRRIAHFFRSYGLDCTHAIDSIALAQTTLVERLDSPKVSAWFKGVRAWAHNCRAWVEHHRDALIAAITAER